MVYLHVVHVIVHDGRGADPAADHCNSRMQINTS
jgi:hypothetical protein